MGTRLVGRGWWWWGGGAEWVQCVCGWGGGVYVVEGYKLAGWK